MIIGNLTKPPELRRTQSDLPVCTFTVAVNRRFKTAQGERETDFFPVVAWRQTAELCAQYLDKGKKCAVSGHLQTRSYDAQDGTKRYVTEIVADEVMFLSPRDGAQASPGGYSGAGFEEVQDDSLPF